MNRSPVSGLGYVVIYSDLQAEWSSFGTDVLGMSAACSDPGDLLLRMDDRIARFIISPTAAAPASGDGNAPAVVGWECRSETDWHDAAEALAKGGVTLTTLEERDWYSEAFSCVDPSGTHCEFFYGPKVDPATYFVSPLGVTFVTGEQALGHVTIATDKCQEATEFYHQLLGFQVRETKTTGVEKTWRWAFLSPNPREHSVAFMNIGVTGRILHILVEVADLDSVGRATDRCIDGLAPLSVSMGRHWNDQMVSAYLRTPSGFDIEYGYGGRSVDPDEWSRRAQGGSGLVSLWGHRIVLPDGTFGPHLGSSH